MEEYDTFSEVENMNSFNLFVLNVLIARDFWEPDNKATFRQNYTWGGWIHVKRNIQVRHVHDLIKFNIWRLIQQMKKKSPKQLTPLSQAFIIFCWIICVWRNAMVLVFVLVSGGRSPPISSLVHAAHYFLPVASAAQPCHFPSGYKGSLTQESQRIDWKSLK